MAWEVVEPLNDLRDQLNEFFPDRDKTSDGSIGDTSHAAGKSSHNPDKTGNPEYADGDSKDEVRARDFDKDLRSDVTAEQVVEHLVKLCRSGVIWWLRYIIFNGHIWRANGGWATQVYTGASKHDHHFHVNGQFNQASDNLQTANYHLEDLVAVTPKDLTAISSTVWGQEVGRTGVSAHDTLFGDMRKGIDAAASAGQAMVAGLSALNKAEQERFAKVVEEFSQVPVEVMNAITGGTDEQIAAALTTLLGDRKDAVVALLSQP